MFNNKIGLEFIWLLITAVVTLLVMLPIYTKLGADYIFLRNNILIIVIAITWCRYIFLLKHHWLSSRKWIKVLFIFIPIPIFFFLIGAFYDFQAFSDEKGIYSIMENITVPEQRKLAKYIRSEILMFWATAFLANAYMPIRMIISLYREIKSGNH